MKSVILSLREKLDNGMQVQTLVEAAKKKAEEFAFTNSIITPIFPSVDQKYDPNKMLSCIPYSLKDNISTEGIKTTAGSKFLQDYVPPFSATVYEILKQQGAILLAKDAMDEFGLGGSGIHCAYGVVCNPLDKSKVMGGSSSGSVANVVTGISAFAIGTDTGDSIRRPASFGGVVGYKPSYGAISRYGVMPYAPSFDHVGIITKYVADATIVASELIKHDEKDATSYDKIKNVSLKELKLLKKIQFVYIKNLVEMLDQQQLTDFNKLIDKLTKEGHYVKGVEIDREILKSISFSYKVLTYTEGYSCYSNLQGITFGLKKYLPDDTYEQSLIKVRTAGIGDEVKRRFIIGAYLTTKENYMNITLAARSIRKQVQELEMELLKQGDCILMPTVSGVALDLKEPHKQSPYDD
ncbi:MAG: Asp-tRNA(Asn)/Glu-tRNA(Gln) amidotransferase subunit GatA [Mycoplasmoidaceae bacterium]|nr:Asp-tRNA(Asn)/Glu-tRNA(Gln) amidotransferase subunit GatA [Mycoplasmoidaceae bacterium]